jgi:hypothetical protein
VNKTCVNASLVNYGTVESLKEILKAKNKLNGVDAKKVVVMIYLYICGAKV